MVRLTSAMTRDHSNYTCFFLPNPSFEYVSHRYESNVSTAVINGLCSPFAIVANLVIITVICRNALLHTPANVLIGCLALSDLLVGLVVQPCYVTFRTMETLHKYVPCTLRIVYSESFWVSYGASFLTLSAISFERLIALTLHLRYPELVTAKAVFKVAGGIWVFDIALTSLEWISSTSEIELPRKIHVFVWFLCLVLSLVAQILTFKILFRHHRQIERQESTVNRTHSDSNASRCSSELRQRKMAFNAAYIVGFYLLCNMPVMCINSYYLFHGHAVANLNMYSWSETIAYLNSCLNPMICCWRSKDLRRHVLRLVTRRRRTRQVSVRSGNMMQQISKFNSVNQN